MPENTPHTDLPVAVIGAEPIGFPSPQPRIDPEHGFYITGMKSYGRAPTFLMFTGYEQVRSIVAALAGDRAAAEQVELVLPETGICSADIGTSCDRSPDNAEESASCYGPAEPVNIGIPTGLAHGRSAVRRTD